MRMSQTPEDVITLTVGAFEVNCHLVRVGPHSAVVIDPGAQPDAILDTLDTHRLKPCAYVLTHGHVDHVSALAAVQKRHLAPAYLHADDAAWAFSPANALPPYYPQPAKPAEPCHPLLDGQTFMFGVANLRVIATPGHTPGCVCLYWPSRQMVFTGDTLFAGSVGRTDLPGGNARRLRESLRHLTALPGATRVLAGHGAATSIADEMAGNPFLK